VGAATDLWDSASHLLDFCAAALNELPVGAPDRQFVSVGYPAIDCPTLAVHVFPVTPGPFEPSTSPGDVFRQGHPYVVLDLVTFTVSIFRCWPSTPDGKQTPKAPTAADYDTASAIMYQDAWQLYNALRAGFNLGLLGGPCKLLRVDQAQPVQPDGGFGGWTILITAQLDGFTPTLPDPLPE
jgi:hypothetical protein